MSNTLFVFLNKSNVPSRLEWQKAIDELGFQVRLKIDADLIPLEDEGFVPCKWGNSEEDVGFELFYEPSVDIYVGDERLQTIAGEKDFCICMIWRGNLKDCAAVMIASCALVKEFGAIFSFEGHDSQVLEALVSSTQDIIVEAGKY